MCASVMWPRMEGFNLCASVARGQSFVLAPGFDGRIASSAMGSPKARKSKVAVAAKAKAPAAAKATAKGAAAKATAKGAAAKATAKGAEGKGAAQAKKSAPESKGSEAAYERYLAQARAIDPEDVIPLRADPALAYHNALVGFDAVMEQKERIAAELPKLNLEEMSALPELGQGLIFACLSVEREEKPGGSKRALLTEAAGLRRLLLASADALAEANVVRPEAIKKIRSGQGLFDIADDCIALAALFRKAAGDTKGKTPVTPSNVERAAEVGATLRRVLMPKGAPRAKPKPGEDSAVAIRDRFWTLFVHQHEQLWRAAAYLYGREVDEHVPALQSRAAVAKKSPKKAPLASP